jgi:hypothetical protein
VHRAVAAHLLELFGGEGLRRAAMHYRWNFDDTNVTFLAKDFSSALVFRGDDEARAAIFDSSSGRMRMATLAFGVSEENQVDVEAAYEEFLELFDAHLADSPYLLVASPRSGTLVSWVPSTPTSRATPIHLFS